MNENFVNIYKLYSLYKAGELQTFGENQWIF